MDPHLGDLIYNVFETQSKKCTQFQVETDQKLQLVYLIDQGQPIYLQRLPDDIVKLMKEG